MYCLLRVLTLFCLLQAAIAHNCYDSNMNSYECEPRDNWCVKLTNASGTYRGCTDVNSYCQDEFTGCLPESETGSDVSWCCCNKDNCNSSHQLLPTTVLFMLFSFVFVNLLKDF